MKIWEAFRHRGDFKVWTTPVARYTIRTYALFQLIYSVAIIIGGQQRWSLETYAVISEIPGAPFSFAIWLMLAAAGVLLMSWYAMRWKNSSRIKDWCWLVMGVWWLTFAVCIAGAVTPDDHVPYSAVVGSASNAALIAWLSMIDERKPLDDAIAFGGAERRLPETGEKTLTSLEETLQILDDSARSLPLLPPGAQRAQHVPDPDPASKPDSDRLR